MQFESITVTVESKIAHIALNRPEKANSLNEVLWKEIKEIFALMDENSEVRVVILSGNGKHFCAGIDLQLFAEISARIEAKDNARKNENLRQLILDFQKTFTAIENCRKPVIAAVHSTCIGAGIDMISACDFRFATQDAYFSIKEIDIGMVADVGTLQRLPHIISDGIMRELAYTGRQVKALEAKEIGLVNRVFENKDQMMSEVRQIAQQIAVKSPLAIRGSKEMIRYARDHSVSDGLNYVATWNAGMLLSSDLQEGVKAQLERRAAQFEN